MSTTPDYDMAPPAATVTVPSPAAGQPLASGATGATDPGAQRPQRRRAASQKDDSLAGLLLPGGAITGLISLCWLIHQFGLPVVIFAILAAAATAVTAAAIKASDRIKAAKRTWRGRTAGGAGPGVGRNGARGGTDRRSAAGAGGGRTAAGNRAGATSPSRSRRATGAAQISSNPGALSRKPSGLGSTKSPSKRTGTMNSANHSLSSTRGLGGARSTAGPKPLKSSLNRAGSRGESQATSGPETNSSRAGLLNRLRNGTSGRATASGAATSNRKGSGVGASGTHPAGKTSAPKPPKTTPAMPGSGTGKPGKGKTPKPPKTTPATPGSGTGKP
ncbi:hypothetical protein AB0H40_22110, partial [Streptomyces filamentosus]|uniref:hypothetical protein n=1 Tax=Streptomyces filamentosus TaxID=67294 RepID=UPI0033FFFA30